MNCKIADSRTNRASLVLVAIGALACGAKTMIGPEPNDPGTDPQATGAAEHLAAAHREERRLSQHRMLYDPRAKSSIRRCDPPTLQRADPECWVETINPTAIHESEMREHSQRAALYRKAARDLRTAKARACKGVARSARETNPFDRSHVLGVSPLEASTGGDVQLLGATIYLQAVAGLSAPELQRAMDCFSAHQGEVGYGLITVAADRSPLSEPGSRAVVRELSHGYAVDVRAEDPAAAQAVWLRAQRLAVVR